MKTKKIQLSIQTSKDKGISTGILVSMKWDAMIR
jgi:hypothetical protein